MSPDKEKLKIRERLFKKLFLAGDRYRSFAGGVSRFCRFCVSVTLALFLIAFIFYIGFSYSDRNSAVLRSTFRIIFYILFIAMFLPEILQIKTKPLLSLFYKAIVFLFSLGVFLSSLNIVNTDKSFWALFTGNTPVVTAIILMAISQIARPLRFISSVNIPPALIFSSSFLIIIVIGSGLLMLPNAHTIPFSYLDSFFTAVSAVCVTGLVVVDTATSFTILGKVIILCLIQIGGLGIMTFTGFFSYVFTSSTSYRDRLMLKEIFSSQSMGSLFKVLTKIIILTFLTEIAGALIIFSGLSQDSTNRILFSVFHSVSAFCNAGFSTLSDGLFSVSIRDNYVVQISVALLIILGGIGFPVLVRVYSYFKHLIISLVRKAGGKQVHAVPEQRNVSGRIVLFMTLFLILAGSCLYYVFEKENSLIGMDTSHKLIVSFFGSVSARTAGFNIADISLWGYPTVSLMIILMWIGASPGSTGGGIKTTTFAIALRSVWNNIRGHEQLVLRNREISDSTLIRVLSIISLSLLVITAGFFGLLISEPGKNPVYLLFESVSAFSTVGLSLADTATFGNTGKIVVIVLMFVGRVGPLTLMTGILVSYHKKYSRYPEIDIIIN